MSTDNTPKRTPSTTSGGPSTGAGEEPSGGRKGPGKSSLNLLRELTSSWSSEPVCVKYSLKDEGDRVEVAVANGSGGAALARVHRGERPPDAGLRRPEELSGRRDFVSVTVEDEPSKTDPGKGAVVPAKGAVAHPAGKASGGASPKGRRWSGDSMYSSYGCAFVPDEEWMRKRGLLLRQCTEYLELESVGSRYTKETFKRGFLNKEVSLRIFQLFDHDEDGFLSQDDWIQFIKERLLLEKQSDLAEQIESVAYIVCGDNKISSDKFYQIFVEKGITDKIFRLIDKDNDGIVTPNQITEVIATLTNIKIRTGFDKDSLEWLEQLFRQTVGNEKEIRRDDFKKILITKNPFFTERVFQIFDRDNSGSISMQEFLDAMHQFAGQSPDDKIKFLFRVYDLDGDGLIQHRELQHVMRACMEENGMRFSEEQVEDLTIALFEDADSEFRGAITYDALKNQLEKHDGLLENLSISIDRWLVPPKPKRKPASLFGKLSTLKPYQLTLPYIKNNYVYLLFLGVFLLINITLFVSRAIQFSESNYCVIIARACGQCLNFNCAFVLVLMLRHCITFLRTRGVSSFLPLDHHIYMHKLTGFFIFLFGLIHTVMHLLNLILEVVPDPDVNEDEYSFVEWLLTAKPGLFGLIGGYANPTGVVLIVILLVTFVCSLPFVRRGGSFEIFYWTHLLYIPFWILMIFHGPNFWKWLLFPGVIYLCERLYRFSVTSSKRGKTYISSGLLLPSRVTHLVIKRPPHFDFHSGDYVFVNIPAIAIYEWHPFTISSAPEQEDYMWLHIRGVGEWTNRLYDYFEREQEKLHNLNESLPVANPQAITVTPNGSVKLANEDEELKLLKATLEGPLCGKSGHTIHGKPIHKRQEMTGYTNQSFSSLPEDFRIHGSTESEISNSMSSNDIHKKSSTRKIQDEKLHKFLLKKKAPLSKSLSMPDIENRMKKRERLLALREYMRSESEKSFDECQMKRARLQSLGLAYLSPQNKSLAQSFRYMRHKPTIIAFKTPSLENYEARIHAAANQKSNPESAAEEGRIGVKREEPNNLPPTGINYPVGKPLEIFIDGPYGAPSSHIFRAQHAVLVATGIGVTPFASILQSIMHRYWKARHTCPQCKYAWVSDIPPTVMHLRKVDFFWINRDQRSFEWFVNLLSQLEIEQAELGGAMERFLDMHMYITSALQKTDMKAVGLQLALDLLHEKEKRDLITGLKTRTNAGRPNWDKVFQQLIDQKKGKVTVFYCGPPELGRVLRVKCDQYGISFRKEVF